jgi:hypothetical protein
MENGQKKFFIKDIGGVWERMNKKWQDAGKSPLRVGDRIIQINGMDMEDFPGLFQINDLLRKEAKITVSLLKEEKQKDFLHAAPMQYPGKKQETKDVFRPEDKAFPAPKGFEPTQAPKANLKEDTMGIVKGNPKPTPSSVQAPKANLKEDTMGIVKGNPNPTPTSVQAPKANLKEDTMGIVKGNPNPTPTPVLTPSLASVPAPVKATPAPAPESACCTIL